MPGLSGRKVIKVNLRLIGLIEGVDMIPEIEEKFKIIEWLRSKRHVNNSQFQQLSQSQQGYLINRTYVIKDLIEILQQ